MEINRLWPSSLPGTPRRRMRPSLRRSLRINSDDRFDASIQAMASSGIAISSVARADQAGDLRHALEQNQNRVIDEDRRPQRFGLLLHLGVELL